MVSSAYISVHLRLKGCSQFRVLSSQRPPVAAWGATLRIGTRAAAGRSLRPAASGLRGPVVQTNPIPPGHGGARRTNKPNLPRRTSRRSRRRTQSCETNPISPVGGCTNKANLAGRPPQPAASGPRRPVVQTNPIWCAQAREDVSL
jgi:hypothetical protein